MTTVLSELERAGMVEQQGEKRRAIGRPPLRCHSRRALALDSGIDTSAGVGLRAPVDAMTGPVYAEGILPS